MNTAIGWVVLLVVLLAGYFLSGWLAAELVKTFAAHTSTNAAAMIVVVRVVTLLVFLVFGLKLASWLTGR